jgi:hypothetical protein
VVLVRNLPPAALLAQPYLKAQAVIGLVSSSSLVPQRSSACAKATSLPTVTSSKTISKAAPCLCHLKRSIWDDHSAHGEPSLRLILKCRRSESFCRAGEASTGKRCQAGMTHQLRSLPDRSPEPARAVCLGSRWPISPAWCVTEGGYDCDLDWSHNGQS